IASLLKTGYNAGAWNGTGIASSVGHADASHSTALGYIDNADFAYASIDGEPVGDHSIVVKFTSYGDSSLDGKVDLGNDFNLFLQGYIGHGSGWELGDYNY